MNYRNHKNKLVIFNSILFAVQVLILLSGEAFIIPLLLTYGLSLLAILINTHLFIYYVAILLNIVFIIFTPAYMSLSLIAGIDESEIGFAIFSALYLSAFVFVLPVFNILFIKNVKLKENA